MIMILRTVCFWISSTSNIIVFRLCFFMFSALLKMFSKFKTWLRMVQKRCLRKSSSRYVSMNGEGNCYPPHSYWRIFKMISRSHFWIAFLEKAPAKMSKFKTFILKCHFCFRNSGSFCTYEYACMIAHRTHLWCISGPKQPHTIILLQSRWKAVP